MIALVLLFYGFYIIISKYGETPKILLCINLASFPIFFYLLLSKNINLQNKLF